MAKIGDMTLDERETHISISGTDRAGDGNWEVYTDDPVVMRELDRKGIDLIRETKGGGRYYSLPQNQLTIRKRRVMSVQMREELSRRAKENFATARQQSSALSMGADLDIDEEEEDDE